MALDLLFAIRGLLSFIAFSEGTNSLRCLLPFIKLPGETGDAAGVPFVRTRVFDGVVGPVAPDAERVLGQVYGLCCALCGLVIINAAVNAHHRSSVHLASVALAAKLVFFSAQAFYYGTVVETKNVVFPLISSAVGLLATLVLPHVASAGLDSFEDQGSAADLRLAKDVKVKAKKKSK